MSYTKPIDLYNHYITPKIKEIDIFLKSKDEIDIFEISKLLEINIEEIKNILKQLDIKKITKENFFVVMLNGNSLICQLYRREIECGLPNFYTPKQLAYIYSLDYKKVLKAYNFLNLRKIKSEQIPHILIQI